MTFEVVHKSVLFAAVALGLAPLSLSGEVPDAVVVVAYGALISAWFYDAPLQRIDEQELWWTLGTIGALLGLSVLAWITENYLLYAIYFALVMVVTRLFQSRGSRDAFQLYGLSFVAMIAGAVANPTLSFVFTFIPYVVVLVWGLIVLHLQRDIEGLQEEQRELGERPADLAWRARNLITPGFLAGSSLLALGIFASSLVIFFFFPRLGFGFFFSQGRQTQSISGFSDRIELGHFGTIKDNMSVVMRVELPDDPRREDHILRMRGISFDHYDGRVWSKTTTRTTDLPRENVGTWRLLHPSGQGEVRGPEVLRQDVYLEPLEMEQRMIFGQPRMLRLSIDNPELDRLRRHPVRFYQDAGGDVSTRVPDDVALRYHVESVPEGDASLRIDGDRVGTPRVISRLYRQLPDDLDPAVETLAREITRGAAGPMEQARALEVWLRANMGYSTDGGHNRDKPLEDFLLNRRSGHCEYFASAMVVMLRTLGVAARPTNGFYGGVYNSFGRFYTVRQADAHSWVETFVPGAGWLTFDPTPPSEVLVPAMPGVWGTVQEWYDSLKLQWYKWVVEYDLEKQWAFYTGVLDRMGALRDALPRVKGNVRSRKAWKEGFSEWVRRPATWIAAATPFILLILWRIGLLPFLWSLLMRLGQRREVAPDGAMEGLYHQMLKRLTRQGVGRVPQETPRELLSRLERAGYEGVPAVRRLTRGFEKARYAQREPSPPELASFEADVEEVRP